MKTSARLMTFSAMGFEFAVLVIAGLFIGLKVDQRSGTSPAGVIVGLVLGLVGAVFRLMSYLKLLKGENKK